MLTALDFVGHQRREFRFDQRFRAMTGVGGKALQRHVDDGFPFLPSGSQIVLDRVAQDWCLECSTAGRAEVGCARLRGSRTSRQSTGFLS